MTDSTSPNKPSAPATNRRVWLSNLLIMSGGCLLFFTSLFGLKTSLAAGQWADEPYLVSTVDLQLPLPTRAITATPEPRRTGSELFFPFVSRNLPSVVQPENPIALSEPTPEPAPIDPAAPGVLSEPAPPAASSGPVVRLVIPQLKVDRAVVTIGLHQQDGKAMQWDTDKLFANRNRPDLVGQLITSVNPGDGGNIVLVGHNYNEGWNGWGAVFVNLGKLSPGSKITLYTENGGEYPYVVQQVKKVPWRKQNDTELEKHQKFLWPTEREQLTLVTCGGELLGVWSHRIYVVAYPETQNSN